MAKKQILVLVLLLISALGFAGGIKGRVYDQNGDPLPFATIYVKEINTGTATNLDGYFELSLVSGNYQLFFQHVGFQTQALAVAVDQDFRELEIRKPYRLVHQ